MCVVQSGQNKIIRVENYEFFVLFLKNYLSSLELPFYMLLFDALTIALDELFQLGLVLELEDFQCLFNRELGVGFLCAFGYLKSDSL